MRVNTVALIGAGSWGTAVAKSIAESKPQVTVRIWAYEKSVVTSINSAHENEFLPGIKLPPSIKAYANLKEAIDGADVVLLATPSKFIYPIAEKIARYITEDMFMGFLTKGFCKVQDEILTISQAIERVVPQQKGRVAAISGPSHAEEVSQRFHTCLNVGSRSAESRAVIAELLTTEYLRCRETDDIRAVEVGGTLKNPAAIAAGMISMLPRCGDNLSGALISEALKEMIRLGSLFGISEESMIDISGLGDLVATALSRHSRNRRFGRDISSQILKKRKSLGFLGKIMLRFKPKNVIERMSEKLNYLAEGAYAIEPLIELAESANISIPVYRSLYEVLLNKKDPSLLIETIKHPARFNELYYDTKINLMSGKNGLENVSGTVFRDMIVRRTIEKFSARLENAAGSYAPGEITKNLREYGSAAESKGHALDIRESRILHQLTMENYDETLRQLAELYFNRIADSFNSLVKWIFFLYIKCIRILNFFSRKKYKTLVSGSFTEIKNIKRSANILYVSAINGAHDFLYIIISILGKGLPFPRFFISSDAIDPRRIFLFKLFGGFIVDANRLDNLLYRETLCQYLSTLAGYGIPILYFPFGASSNASDYGVNEFFTHVIESLYGQTAEITLVPVEVSYLARPAGQQSGALSIREIMSNVVHVNFSDPISMPEYANQPTMIDSLVAAVRDVWERDKKIFPHYVLCKIIALNDYSINLDSAEKLVKDFISHADKRFDYTPARMVKKGMNFLIRNGIASIKNGFIVAEKPDDVEYYSNML